ARDPSEGGRYDAPRADQLLSNLIIGEFRPRGGNRVLFHGPRDNQTHEHDGDNGGIQKAMGFHKWFRMSWRFSGMSFDSRQLCYFAYGSEQSIVAV
ncbi:MAG: hypothetical protein ACK5T6_19945, partial [Pirellula sp.]